MLSGGTPVSVTSDMLETYDSLSSSICCYALSFQLDSPHVNDSITFVGVLTAFHFMLRVSENTFCVKSPHALRADAVLLIDSAGWAFLGTLSKLTARAIYRRLYARPCNYVQWLGNARQGWRWKSTLAMRRCGNPSTSCQPCKLLLRKSMIVWMVCWKNMLVTNSQVTIIIILPNMLVC